MEEKSLDQEYIQLAQEYITLSNKYQLLAKGLKVAGKYARDNPPGDLPDDPMLLQVFIGGDDRDPAGEEFIGYWLTIAQKLIEKEKT